MSVDLPEFFVSQCFHRSFDAFDGAFVICVNRAVCRRNVAWEFELRYGNALVVPQLRQIVNGG